MAGLYIHIPFCKRKCAYCDFPSVAGREGDSGRYFTAVAKEAELWKNSFRRQPAAPPSKREVGRGGANTSSPSLRGMSPTGDRGSFTTIFLGGGTPSLLPAGELERLMGRLRLLFCLEPKEFTVEANPGTVDKAKLESFRRMGANRVSFGAQAAQDGLLKRIGRIHTWEDFVLSCETARSVGFTNINADMMTGLPGQTANDAVDTARRLVDLGVEHVSCYGLIVEEGTPLSLDVEKGDEIPPDGDKEREMFHASREVFEAAGLRRYEISNFARPGYECRHNLNYWLSGDWLGLGPGAASHFSGYRRENLADLDAYMAALERGMPPPAQEHTIGPDETVFETVMLELRLVDGIDFKRFAARHGFEFMEKYRKQVDHFVASGLMRKSHAGVALTERGMDLQNTVLMEFMS